MAGRYGLLLAERERRRERWWYRKNRACTPYFAPHPGDASRHGVGHRIFYSRSIRQHVHLGPIPAEIIRSAMWMASAGMSGEPWKPNLTSASRQVEVPLNRSTPTFFSSLLA